MSGFKTVFGEAEAVNIIERSKFICVIKGIDNEEDAKTFIAEAKKRYPLANHYCYAYIADEKGLNQKFSDDGEPHGTAGLQILNAVKNSGLFKTVAVVVRFFGGIKLGTGGLSRAYGGVVVDAIGKAEIRALTEAEFFTFTLSYAQYKKLAPLIAGTTVSTEYGSEVQVKVAVSAEGGEKKLVAAVSEVLGESVPILGGGKGFFEFKK